GSRRSSRHVQDSREHADHGASSQRATERGTGKGRAETRWRNGCASYQDLFAAGKPQDARCRAKPGDIPDGAGAGARRRSRQEPGGRSLSFGGGPHYAPPANFSILSGSRRISIELFELSGALKLRAQAWSAQILANMRKALFEF